MRNRYSNRFIHESVICLHVFRLTEEKFPENFKSGKNPSIKYFRIKRYLLSRGIELALKAFLCDHGVGLTKLRSKKFGHNIEKLLLLSKEEGLRVLSDKEEAIIKILNQIYFIKGFEYENNIFKNNFGVNVYEAIAQKLIDAIQKDGN